MIRLSCPLLTKAIDQFEYEGTGIKKLNEDLNEPDPEATEETVEVVDPELPVQRTHDSQPKLMHASFSPATKELREHYKQINSHWRGLKNAIVNDEQRIMLKERLGEEEAEHFMNSGIGGITESNVDDVKCLHLHTADALLRGKENNRFGAWTLETLEKERGVEVNGCAGKNVIPYFVSQSLLNLCHFSQTAGSSVTATSSALQTAGGTAL